ncbi:MAG: hypothetical protein P2A85_11010 [Microcoleus anatoxicus]|uniref:Uncharacterized protein n=1 Tax=Microcoleus anatoxicus PTRS2 TaxID=2705321 RepID=A0ABU8YS12_9CYAN
MPATYSLGQEIGTLEDVEITAGLPPLIPPRLPDRSSVEKNRGSRGRSQYLKTETSQ